jgi:tyrosine-protein phosphatase YwqE
VHVLASDSHDARHRPPDPRLAERALTDRYGDVEELLAWMTTAAPAAVLAGTPLPDRPPLPRARTMRDRIRQAWSAR